MQPRAARRSTPQAPGAFYASVFKLAIGGGIAFWVANFATSLTPLAAEYRAALSISYLRMVVVESLLGGIVIGGCVSYCLLRFFDRIPTRSPVMKAEILSCVALAIAIVVVQDAASLFEGSEGARYFAIGALLNVPRFLILGFAIGYLYERLNGPAPRDLR